jgi:hypothetical protein
MADGKKLCVLVDGDRWVWSSSGMMISKDKPKEPGEYNGWLSEVWQGDGE